MLWSFSGHRTFVQCQRKWFFMQKMANALVKNDPKRREAYLLCQLKSLPAWRGSLVDKVIEETVVPSLVNRMVPSENAVLEYSNKLVDMQLNFALAKRYREAGMTKKAAGSQYAALFELEYQGKIDPQELAIAKGEIETALKNLFSCGSLFKTLLQARWLGAQKSLLFKLNGTDISVRAHPDLLAFYNKETPLIIDWKVSTERTADYWLQLAVYALALSRSDWPAQIATTRINPTEVRMIEANLLTNNFKEHRVDEKDLAELEDFISDSAWQMGLLDNGGKYIESEVEEYGTARNPRSCEYCQFQRLCW